MSESLTHVSCSKCTFLNVNSASNCEICSQPLVRPPASKTWACCKCSSVNVEKEQSCTVCLSPRFITTSSTVATKFCCQCGHKLETIQCSKCGYQSKIFDMKVLNEEIRAGTNSLARDLGVQIRLSCPYCTTIVSTAPGGVVTICPTCERKFASPEIGSAASFHLHKITNQLQQSVSSFFRKKETDDKPQQEEQQVPVGIRIESTTANPPGENLMGSSIAPTSEAYAQTSSQNQSSCQSVPATATTSTTPVAVNYVHVEGDVVEL